MAESVTGTAAWTTDEWRVAAVEWIDRELRGSGFTRTSQVELARMRPWSMLMRAETTAGQVWFKACGAGTAFEPPLYDVLHRVTPEFVLTPLAVDTARGWLLLPDGRPSLSEAVSEDELLDATASVFVHYAEFQLRVSRHLPAILGTGVADMRPSVVPQRFEEALAYVEGYVTRQGNAAVREELARIAGMRPRVQEWADRLAAAPGAPSLDHNDLHAHNVFVTRVNGSLHPRFFDWGDAVVAHPFASMLVGLGFLVRRFKLSLEDPRVLRARDAYLEPFTALGRRAELIETLETAVRASCIARSLTWKRAVEHAAPDDPHANHEAPWFALRGLLAESYLAGGT